MQCENLYTWYVFLLPMSGDLRYYTGFSVLCSLKTTTASEENVQIHRTTEKNHRKKLWQEQFSYPCSPGVTHAISDPKQKNKVSVQRESLFKNQRAFKKKVALIVKTSNKRSKTKWNGENVDKINKMLDKEKPLSIRIWCPITSSVLLKSERYFDKTRRLSFIGRPQSIL